MGASEQEKVFTFETAAGIRGVEKMTKEQAIDAAEKLTEFGHDAYVVNTAENPDGR